LTDQIRARLARAYVALVARLHGPVYELPRAMTVPVSPSLMKEEYSHEVADRDHVVVDLVGGVEGDPGEFDHDPFHGGGPSGGVSALSALGV
jgi:hypothetical protein